MVLPLPRYARNETALASLPHAAIGSGALAIDTPANRRRATACGVAGHREDVGRLGIAEVQSTSQPCLQPGCALRRNERRRTASMLTLLVGLLCAWTASQPGYAALVAMGLLFHLASVLDGVDGEIARATPDRVGVRRACGHHRRPGHLRDLFRRRHDRLGPEAGGTLPGHGRV